MRRTGPTESAVPVREHPAGKVRRQARTWNTFSRCGKAAAAAARPGRRERRQAGRPGGREAGRALCCGAVRSPPAGTRPRLPLCPTAMTRAENPSKTQASASSPGPSVMSAPCATPERRLTPCRAARSAQPARRRRRRRRAGGASGRRRRSILKRRCAADIGPAEAEGLSTATWGLPPLSGCVAGTMEMMGAAPAADCRGRMRTVTQALPMRAAPPPNAASSASSENSSELSGACCSGAAAQSVRCRGPQCGCRVAQFAPPVPPLQSWTFLAALGAPIAPPIARLLSSPPNGYCRGRALKPAVSISGRNKVNRAFYVSAFQSRPPRRSSQRKSKSQQIKNKFKETRLFNYARAAPNIRARGEGGRLGGWDASGYRVINLDLAKIGPRPQKGANIATNSHAAPSGRCGAHVEHIFDLLAERQYFSCGTVF